MGYEIPEKEPAELTAGDSWYWNRSYGEYPASDGWELSYYLRGETDADWLFGSKVTADGDSFEVRVPADDTGAIEPGGYRLVGRVAKAGESHVVYDARLIVQVDPTAAVSAKTYAQTILAAHRTALTDRLSSSGKFGGGKIVVTVSGDEFRYASPEDLRSAIAVWELTVELEKNPDARLSSEVHFR